VHHVGGSFSENVAKFGSSRKNQHLKSKWLCDDCENLMALSLRQ